MERDLDRVTVRPEQARDRAAIRRVVTAAFGSDAEADLVDRIRTSPGYVAELALVAELDSEVVGHVMISHAVIRHAAGERRIAMLSPLAVAPDRQREGIGGLLVRAVVAAADHRREPIVILEGSPDYYGRFGFEHSVRHGIEIELPSWAPPEAAQVRLLDAFDPDDATLRGQVVYPAAFDGLE